jgi:hypothetical protein
VEDVEDVVVGGVVEVLGSGVVVDAVVGGIVEVLDGSVSVDVVPTPTLLPPHAAVVTSRRGTAAREPIWRHPSTRTTFLMVPLHVS